MRREAVRPASTRAEGGIGAGRARRIGVGSVHNAALEAAAAGSAGDDLLAGREMAIVEVEERVSRAIAHAATYPPQHVSDVIVPEAEPREGEERTPPHEKAAAGAGWAGA